MTDRSTQKHKIYLNKEDFIPGELKRNDKILFHEKKNMNVNRVIQYGDKEDNEVDSDVRLRTL